jgi:hypothetical protein
MRKLALVTLLALAPSNAAAQLEPGAYSSGPFDQGSMSLSLAFGASSSASGTYYVVGGGFGFFVLDGVELSIDVEHWFGDSLINITKLSPGARYVVYQVPTLHPYAGVFYRHWFRHSDLVDDADTVGARVGAIYAPGRRLFVSLGAMYEILLDCQTECDTWSPEISIGVVF